MTANRDFERADDATLIIWARSGDPYAFEALARRYERLVYSIALGRSLTPADAEDAAQESLIRAYQNIGRLRSPDRFRPWITRIVIHCSSNQRRHSVKVQPMDPAAFIAQADPNAETARNHELNQCVSAALESLDPERREAVLLRFIDGAKYGEIADALMISRANAEVRVRRALSEMRDYLVRHGIARDVRETLQTHCLALVASVSLVDSVHERLMKCPPPATPKGSLAGLLPSAALGTVLTTALTALVAMNSAQTDRQRVETAAEPTRSVRAVSVHVVEPTSAIVRAKATPKQPDLPVERTLLPADTGAYAPDTPVPGWTSGVYAASEPPPKGVPGNAFVVNTNIPSAYTRFPLTRGIVTVNVWLKPKLGDDANMALHVGNELGGSIESSGALIVFPPVYKNDDGMWRLLGTPEHREPFAFARYRGEWAHFVVNYDTTRNTYDVTMNDTLVAENRPTTVDLSGGISFVGISSGRWHRELDSESHFAGLTVTARGTDAETPRRALALPWVKPYAKPVLPVSPDAFDSVAVEDVTVLYEGGHYRMWYLGWAGGLSKRFVGYATSPDGTRWTKRGVVLEPGTGWEQNGLLSLSVIRDGDGYRMWYSAGTRYSDSAAVGTAASPDGVHRTRDERNPVVPAGSIPANVEYYVRHVSRLADGYRMWFRMLPNEENGTSVLATATSDDGFRWRDAKPCLEPDRAAGEIEVADAEVRFGEDGYEAWAAMTTMCGGHVVRFTSSDGVRWTRDRSAPPLIGGNAGEWDYPHIQGASAIRTGDRTRFWYVGGVGVKQVGYAEYRQAPASSVAATVPQQPTPRFRVLPNYPNPFNPETWIPFELDATSRVTVNIYGAKGELVRRLDLGVRDAGSYTSRDNAAHWDGRNEQGEKVASGVYTCQIRTEKASATRRMVVRK